MNPSQSHHLKQYTCYELTPLLKGDFKPQATLRLTFNGNTPCIFQELKHSIIDSISGTDKMYICKWQSGATQAMRLIIFEFNSDNYYMVQMSRKPSFINIVNKSLFIVGGGSLYVIKLNEMKLEATYNLGADTVHAVQPSFPEEMQESAGVCVYAWNDRVGYTKRFYSQNRGHEGKWWSSIMSTITLRKPPAQLINTTLKVIIPNVLGLLILSNLEQICLMNLSTMQPIQNCSMRLTSWSVTRSHRCIVKYHVNKNSQGFDDSLLISIGQKERQMIQVFVFHIKYQPEIVQRYTEQFSNSSGLPSITSFTSGDVLDWNQCVLSPFIACSTEGTLIDYYLTETGVIFYANTFTRIPVSAFISYVQPLNTNPILCLEHNICGSYLSDNDLVNKIEQCRQNFDKNNFYENESFQDYEIQLMNSLLRPNRYSLDFLCLSIGAESINQIKVSMINSRKLLLDWQKYYKIRSITIFNGDIIILRQNSISSLLTITPQQYIAEYRQGQKLVQILQNIQGNDGKNSQLGFQLSIPESNYSDRLPNGGFNVRGDMWNELRQTNNECFTYEKEGHLIEANLQGDNSGNKQQLQALSYYEQYYQNFMSKINKNLQSNSIKRPHNQAYQSPQISNKLLIFSKQIIINRVKDIIQFYSKILKFLYMKSRQAKCDGLNIDPKLQRLLIQYLSGLNGMLCYPLHQVSAHGTDLIESFITKELLKLFQGMNKDNNDDNVNITKNVEKQAWKIMSSFCEGILRKQQTIQLNRFIKQMINTIKSGYYYIQHILLDIFNPYSSPNNFQAFDNDASTNLCEMLTNAGNEQAHFPLSSTLLTIYSYLPVSYSVRTQLITSFVLDNFMHQGSEKIMNKTLACIVATKDFKDKVRQTYYELIDYKKQYSVHMMRIKVEDDQRRRMQKSSRKSKAHPDPYQNQQMGMLMENNEAEKIQIDDTRGIIQLAKIIQLSELEEHLKKLTDERLQAIFRVNIEYTLQGNLGTGTNKKRTLRMKQNKNEAQDILIGWILKYRAYVSRLKDLITQIQGKEYKRMHKMQSYVQHCIRSLENVKIHYANVYRLNYADVYRYYRRTAPNLDGEEDEQMGQPNYDNQQDDFLIENEEQFIERVCCRMIGANSSAQLRLYSQSSNPDCQFANKILPTSNFLVLMEEILHDPNAKVEAMGDFHTFAFFYLNKIFEEPSENVNLFRQLSVYFDRKFLNYLIVQNGYLRDKYENLSEDDKSEKQIKGYFGYESALQLTGPGMIRENQIRSRRTKLGNRINNYKDQRKKTTVYEILPFRNAYLQAINI